MEQKEKAHEFHKLHQGGRLLLLPNVWDILSAKLVATLKCPAVATSSMAIAINNGYYDGENIPLHELLRIVQQIAKVVDPLPLSVDFEQGYAGSLKYLKANIRQLLDTGVVGINIEDSRGKGLGMTTISEQQQKIDAIREVATIAGVPLLINARTDIYLQQEGGGIDALIERTSAYKAAGADCIFPIMINSYADIAALIAAVKIPVSVMLTRSVSDLQQLERLGVARASVGANLMKVALTKMKTTIEGMLNLQTGNFFDEELISPEFLQSIW